MSIYKPTWLYIKQHNITGLKYFGKTVEKDPRKYPGSGSYWTAHLEKHGNEVTTVWCKLFESREEVIEYAMKFSLENNIAQSDDWANLVIENGIDGAPPGQVPWNKGKKASDEHRKNQSQRQTGKKKVPVSEERKAKQSAAMSGRPGRIPTQEEIERRIKTRRENYEKKKAQGFSYAGPNNNFYGKKHTQESIEKIKKSLAESRKSK